MDEFENAVNQIKEKIGDENSALVSDELASILSEHKATLQTHEEDVKTIDSLKNDKENLVNANAKLFQRLGFSEKQEPHFDTPKTEEKQTLQITDIINEKGDII